MIMKLNGNRMRIAIFLLAALVMVSCAKMEFEDWVECLIEKGGESKSVGLLDATDGWNIIAYYFLDKDTWKPKAKIRKMIDGNRWCYYNCDSLGKYQFVTDMDPRLFLADYELGSVAEGFKYGADSVRLHRSGFYPKGEPNSFLIIVTKKEVY